MGRRDALLAIDQGTTSSRAIVFALDGTILALAREPLPQIYPAPGEVEHDPEAIWSGTLKVARAALAEAEAKGARVAAIGITNQRETALLWDRASGRPLGNAIVWQDRRTAQICARLKADGAEAMVAERTGLVLDPYFSATKFAWLLDRTEGARARAEAGELAAGTVDSFLVWRLTGGRRHVTDATNASRTSLYDIAANAWDSELARLFRVPAAVLPEVLDSAAFFGETQAEHFGRPLPILGVAGDQQAATIGEACIARGDVKATYGTGAFLVLNTGEEIVRSTRRLLSTIAWRLEGRTTYALEGSIFVAGAAIQWLRDELGALRDAAESEALAAGLASNAGVYLVPAFAGLGAPHWDPHARGTVVGLTRGSGRAALARAALEAVAYQSAELLAAMAADGVAPRSLRVDGGMVVNGWLCQFLADILAMPVERPAIVETTAFGAAALAGLEAGLFASLQDIAARWRLERRFAPGLDAAERERLLAGWSDAVARAKGR
ncbi:MAG: glycerol kinase GlpK [Alphaproteobacteria bacterium]|nr:glycerol kinase GlpK [Alphaproteobacteria bacterium]